MVVVAGMGRVRVVVVRRIFVWVAWRCRIACWWRVVVVALGRSVWVVRVVA